VRGLCQVGQWTLLCPDYFAGEDDDENKDGGISRGGNMLHLHRFPGQTRTEFPSSRMTQALAG
jgi:hypothetical protein